MNRMARNLQNRFGQVGFVLGFLVLTGCSRIFILESPTLSNLFTTSLGENGSSISCRRPCPFRRNKIVLDHYGLNGLSDRESIFRDMTSLAGYLCATVYAPPPGTMLSVKHNNNQAIPMALMWRDFFSFLFLENNTTALRQFQTNFPKGAPWEQAFNLDQVSAFRPPSDLSNDTWWRISTRKSKKLVSQVAELESFVEEQQGSRLKPSAKTGFIWEVYTTPYVWRDDLSKWFLEKDTERRRSIPQLGGGVPGGRDGCRYSWRVPSPLATAIVDLVFERIRLQHPSTDSLGLFHIRRGDSVAACDTSLPRIHDYLSCTFPNEEPRRSEIASRFGKVVLLLASDERDACYREAIRQLVEQGFGYGFVDLDETIQAVVKDYASRHTSGNRLVNNMYVYHILTLIAEDARIAFVLEQRRHINCPNCTDVMKYLNGGEGRYFYSPGLRSTAPSSKLKWHFPQTIDQYEACTNASKEGV